MSKEKTKAPSRVRYEQSHPVISCRVSKDLYDKLQDIKQAQKRSFADILKVGLGILKSDAAKEKETFHRGYDEGYSKAEKEFKVDYACSVCGKIISLKTEDEKRAAAEYMAAHRWGHAECHIKRR